MADGGLVFLKTECKRKWRKNKFALAKKTDSIAYRSHPMPADVMATGMDSAPSSSRDVIAEASDTPAGSQDGALPPEVISLLIPRTINEDGELEEQQAELPATLAPAFSRETLEALRAERQARRTAAVPPPLAESAPSARASARVLNKDKLAKSQRSGSNSPPDSQSRSSSAKKSSGIKSNRVYLAMPSARETKPVATIAVDA